MKVNSGTFLPLELRVAGGNTKSRWDMLPVELKEMVWGFKHGKQFADTREFIEDKVIFNLRVFYCDTPEHCTRVMDLMDIDYDYEAYEGRQECFCPRWVSTHLFHDIVCFDTMWFEGGMCTVNNIRRVLNTVYVMNDNDLVAIRQHGRWEFDYWGAYKLQ